MEREKEAIRGAGRENARWGGRGRWRGRGGGGRRRSRMKRMFSISFFVVVATLAVEGASGALVHVLLAAATATGMS
jgi:hypothetical protein